MKAQVWRITALNLSFYRMRDYKMKNNAKPKNIENPLVES